MLKPTTSFVLASFKGSTYNNHVRFAFSLPAASLDGRFEHLL
ncbi:hypothetical protein COMA1_10132 [Candidatus Nitrospira nitrosa]|uniref:Uncharacterized protein n=1 Tax=Candidatus Nitrospira nitrosa TaxID=1742972 RepID=A0A0S4L6T2_9BACT|nr:hypothetical protein COMA1_10132 [Candidatus Nitrospira nitrosa]